jgi:hypothetical protein
MFVRLHQTLNISHILSWHSKTFFFLPVGLNSCPSIPHPPNKKQQPRTYKVFIDLSHLSFLSLYFVQLTSKMLDKIEPKMEAI